VRFLASILAGALLIASMPAAAGTDLPADVRYQPRDQAIDPVPFPALTPAPLGAQTTFSPFVGDIVAGLSFAEYDGYLRDLTGERSITVGGEPYTMTTRYSYAEEGQVCWVYAYEQLAALGYDVRYQEYTHSGHELKNIVATIPGTTAPKRIYVLGGHIDAISEIPSTLALGAEDNASGSSGVLAAAAALAGWNFESTIEIVLFSGEEQGLRGSRAYVADALTNHRDIRAVVTFDMIAYHNNDYGVLIEGETPWASLMQVMADAVDEYTTLERDFSYYSFGSDHVPFQDAGIPAILAIDLDWAEYPYYHRSTDTYNRTTPALGQAIATAGLATIAQLAGPLGVVSDVAVATRAERTLLVYPNPAVGVLQIRSALEQLRFPVEVFDPRGRRVRVLHGARSLTWDLRDDEGRAVRPGLYWIRHGQTVEKAVIVR